MRISDWSSDVCSSDLRPDVERQHGIWQRQRFLDDAGILAVGEGRAGRGQQEGRNIGRILPHEAIARGLDRHGDDILVPVRDCALAAGEPPQTGREPFIGFIDGSALAAHQRHIRSEEHTSELQSLMRISYAVYCFTTQNIYIPYTS